MADFDMLQSLVASSVKEVKEEFFGPVNTTELVTYLKDILPLNPSEYKLIHIQGNASRFKANLVTVHKDEKEISNFVERYCLTTNETLRKVSPRHLSDKNMYSVAYYYRCQHKTRYQATMNPKEVIAAKPSKRLKNTDCPYSLTVKLRKVSDEYPCEMDLEWNHNHPVDALQSLSFKDVAKNVTQKIKQMFENGYTPALAYNEFIKGIKQECSDSLEFHLKLADRSKVPSRRDFNNLFTEYKRSKYGSKNLTEMFKVLENRINLAKEQHSDYDIILQTFDEEERDPFILAVVTPLMKRIHEKVNIHYYYIVLNFIHLFTLFLTTDLFIQSIYFLK